ncbi:MAG: hypothetical protein BAJALOKI1v1_2480002 [Promethearchaeota archaeon]|nr:MAG: hypothetical protein BAJALOKI1v1_2480002 [Candidatus Lokiarchaeota archaeon]
MSILPPRSESIQEPQNCNDIITIERGEPNKYSGEVTCEGCGSSRIISIQEQLICAHCGLPIARSFKRNTSILTSQVFAQCIATRRTFLGFRVEGASEGIVKRALKVISGRRTKPKGSEVKP